MSDKVRLRVTVTFEYDADPIDYETADPTEMAKIDETIYSDDLRFLCDALTMNDVSVSVTPTLTNGLD